MMRRFFASARQGRSGPMTSRRQRGAGERSADGGGRFEASKAFCDSGLNPSRYKDRRPQRARLASRHSANACPIPFPVVPVVTITDSAVSVQMPSCHSVPVNEMSVPGAAAEAGGGQTQCQAGKWGDPHWRTRYHANRSFIRSPARARAIMF